MNIQFKVYNKETLCLNMKSKRIETQLIWSRSKLISIRIGAFEPSSVSKARAPILTILVNVPFLRDQ